MSVQPFANIARDRWEEAAPYLLFATVPLWIRSLHNKWSSFLRQTS